VVEAEEAIGAVLEETLTDLDKLLDSEELLT
jgi:hypothetical protein